MKLEAFNLLPLGFREQNVSCFTLINIIIPTQLLFNSISKL